MSHPINLKCSFFILTLFSCRYINYSAPNLELQTPKILSRLQPSAKLIAILRDPTTATYSSFNYFSSYIRNPTAAKFHECVVSCISVFYKCKERYNTDRCAMTIPKDEDLNIERECNWVMRAIKIGRYVVFLKQWMNQFPRENFFIMQMEFYSNRKRPILEKIWNFLGVRKPDSYILRQISLSTGTVNHKSYHEPMFNETEKLLRKYFSVPNKQLAALLNDKKFLWIKQPM